jgi:hypothetical protein
MASSQMELQDWLFPHLVSTDGVPSTGIPYAEFPKHLSFYTEVANMVIEVQGWWTLWHPLLYCFDVTLQIVPADAERFRSCTLLQQNKAFTQVDTGITPPRPTASPFFTFYVASCRVKLRPITPHTFTSIMSFILDRFLDGWRRRGKRYGTGQTDPSLNWGSEIRAAIQRHPWYVNHAKPVASSSRRVSSSSPTDPPTARTLHWITFLKREEEKALDMDVLTWELEEKKGKRRKRRAMEDDTEVEQEEERDGKKEKKKRLTWARACLISRENLDYLCVSEYPDLLLYVPMHKLAFVPSDLLGTLNKRIHKRGVAFFRLFFGIQYLDTFESLATPACIFHPKPKSNLKGSDEKKEAGQKKTCSLPWQAEEEEEEAKLNCTIMNKKRKVPPPRARRCNRTDKKDKKDAKEPRDKIYGDDNDDDADKVDDKDGEDDLSRAFTWRGEREIQYHFWGTHLKHPSFRNQREGTEEADAVCTCEQFAPRPTVATQYLSAFETEVPILKDLFGSLRGKMNYMNDTCKQLMDTLGPARNVSLHMTKEPDGRSAGQKERDTRLDALLHQYRIRLDLGEMMALQYGSVEEFRNRFPTDMDPADLGWELQRIYFYNCLMTDAKMANGHTMTHIRFREADEVKLHASDIRFETRPTMQIAWHRLGEPAVVDTFRKQMAKWKSCWPNPTAQPHAEARRFHSLFFAPRYASSAKKQDSFHNESLSLEELAAIPALLSLVGKVPRTSFYRRENFIFETTYQQKGAAKSKTSPSNNPDLDFLQDLAAMVPASDSWSLDFGLSVPLAPLTGPKVRTQAQAHSAEEKSAMDDMAFLMGLGGSSSNNNNNNTPSHPTKKRGEPTAEPSEDVEDEIAFQRADHTRLIRDLVHMNQLWFQPALDNKEEKQKTEEQLSVQPYHSRFPCSKRVPLPWSPYNLFLYRNLFQVSAMLIQLAKWHRHTSVKSPIALGLIHVNDLSPACQQRFFPSYVSIRQTVQGASDTPSRIKLWATYRDLRVRKNVRAPSVEQARHNEEDKALFPQRWMTFYQKWAPPVVLQEYNPLCLRPTDAKMTPTTAAIPFPPLDGKSEHVSLAYFDSLALESRMKADQHQLVALDTIYQSPVTITEGPAGSGKTTILQRLRGVSDSTMLVLVPTHQVRQTIDQKIRKAMTTARFLQTVRSDPLGVWCQRFRNIQIVVIDEGSLLSESDACELFPILLSLPSMQRIVILGDDQQLPPISGGCVLRDMKALPFVRVCRLEANHRVVVTKSKQDNLATLQAAYWKRDWDEVNRMLLGIVPSPPASSSSSSSLPFNSETSARDLMRLLQAEAKEKEHSTVVSAGGGGAPRPPPGHDIVAGLRIHWMAPQRQKELYDYMYKCVRGMFGFMKCVTFQNKQRIAINNELLQRHLDTLPLGPSQKALELKDVGLVVGVPYKCTDEHRLLVLVEEKQHVPEHEASNYPRARYRQVFKNDLLWMHEMCEIHPVWMTKGRPRNLPAPYGNKCQLSITSMKQMVVVPGYTQPVTYEEYLKITNRQVVVRLSPDPPEFYTQESRGWKRPYPNPQSETKAPPVRGSSSGSGVRVSGTGTGTGTGTGPCLSDLSTPPVTPLRSPSPLRRTPSFQERQAAMRACAIQMASPKKGVGSLSSPSAPPSPMTAELAPASCSPPPQPSVSRRGEWYIVDRNLLKVLEMAFCQTVDSMQGSERADIHFVCDDACSSARIKVAMSRAQQHCDVYTIPKLNGSASMPGSREQEQYYAAQLLVERLKRPTVERITAMDIVSSFLFVVHEQSVVEDMEYETL